MAFQEQNSCLFDPNGVGSEVSFSLSAAVRPWRVVQDHRTFRGTLQSINSLFNQIFPNLEPRIMAELMQEMLKGLDAFIIRHNVRDILDADDEYYRHGLTLIHT